MESPKQSSGRGLAPSALLALAALAAAPAVEAQVLEVSGPLGPNLGDGGDVRDFLVSPDGTRIVYVADQDLDGIEEHYASAIDGSGFVKLNPAFSPTFNIDILDYRISPDGEWVVTRVQRVTGVTSTFLVSVRIDGSRGPFLLSPSQPGIPVLDYEIAPDSTRVVFVASPSSQLYQTPIDGSAAPEDLSGSLAGAVGGPPFSGPAFRITPDGSRVVFVADKDVRYVYELWSVPTEGGAAPVKLSGVLAAGGAVETGFDVGPDSERVVYLADASVDESYELWSAPVDGTDPPVKISGTLAAGGDVEPGFQIAPDALRVVYRADQDLDDRIELYATAIDASFPAVKINGPLVPGSDVGEFLIGAGAGFVVYRADEETDDVQELFSVAIPSLARAKVSGPLVLGGVVEPDFALAPDGTRVVYRADQDTRGVVELYGAPIDGSAPAARLSGALVAGGEVESFLLDETSQHVVYRADADIEGVPGLYRVSIGSGPVTKLDGPSAPRTGVQEFALAPGVGAVVYRADSTALGAFEAFGVPIAGGTAPVKLSGPLVLGSVVGDVTEMHVAPGGRFVVYRADAEADGVDALYSVRLDRPFAPRRISGPLVLGETVALGFQVSPDGKRVVFHRGLTAPRWDLYSAPIDGSLPPVRLNGTLVAGGSTYPTLSTLGYPNYRPGVQISPDGRWVVYLADEDTFGLLELYSAPIDGSLPAIKIHPPLQPASIGVLSYAIGPGSDRVVLLGSLDTLGVSELYSAPIDGGAGGGPGFVKLNHPLPLPGSDVLDFLVAPAGDRVVYRVKEGATFAHHLYGVPIDASQSPVRLDGPLVAGGNVQLACPPRYPLPSPIPFAISPDGASVIYVADQEEDGRHELFAVPGDGSAASVKLNAPLVAGGDVDFGVCSAYTNNILPFVITSDGTRLVYVADQDVDDVFELYGVDVAAPGAAVVLSGPMVAGGDVQDVVPPFLSLSPDGRSVLYYADQITDGVLELFATPIDGSVPSVRLNGPLVFAGGVGGAVFSPSSRDVLYLADEGVNELFELRRVPVDASRAPVVANGSLVPGGEVALAPAPVSFTGPGGELFLYVADQQEDGVNELYLGFLGKPVRHAGSAPSAP